MDRFEEYLEFVSWVDEVETYIRDHFLVITEQTDQLINNAIRFLKSNGVQGLGADFEYFISPYIWYVTYRYSITLITNDNELFHDSDYIDIAFNATKTAVHSLMYRKIMADYPQVRDSILSIKTYSNDGKLFIEKLLIAIEAGPF